MHSLRWSPPHLDCSRQHWRIPSTGRHDTVLPSRPYDRLPFRKFVYAIGVMCTDPSARAHPCSVSHRAKESTECLSAWKSESWTVRVLAFAFLSDAYRGDDDRWNHKIVDYKVWRKSSQFIALKRSHASLAADDAELSARFQQYCFTTWDPIRNLCVADEHYFPTLIAYHGLENQVRILMMVLISTNERADGHRSVFL